MTVNGASKLYQLPADGGAASGVSAYVCRLPPFDVTPGQYGVLYCLWRQAAANPKDIAQILGLENSTISGVLDRMQKKGLIERVISQNDRRCIEVLLTEKGEALEGPVLEIISQVNELVLSRFSSEDASTLLNCLRAIGEADLTDAPEAGIERS